MSRPEDSQSTPDAVRPVRILWVDGSVPESARATLESKPRLFDIDTTTSAGDALSSLDGATPDCVVSEYRLPDGDGIELLEHVRERDDDVPFFVFTDEGSEAVAARAIQRGATGYVRKTADGVDPLLEGIEQAVDTRRAARTHRETADRYRTLLPQVNTPVVVTRAGELLDVNDAFLDLVGRPDCDAAKGTLLSSCFRGDDEASVRSWVENPPDDQRVIRQSVRIEREEGTTREVRLGTAPVTYGGRPATQVVVHDLTERRKRDRELHEFRAAVEHAGHAIYIVDTDGCIRYANPQFEEITGYEAAAVVGERLDLFDPQQWDPDGGGGERSDGTATQRESTVAHRASGELYHAQRTVAPIENGGELSGYVVVEQDVTDRRIYEQRLTVLNRVLRHNLRHVIRGLAERLGREDPVVESEEIAATICESADELIAESTKARHVEKVLDSAHRRTRSARLGDLLESLHRRAAEEFPDATVRIDDDSAADRSVDASLRDALWELVENSIEHTESQQVWLAADAADGMVSVELTDCGPGVPEMERSALLEGNERPLEHGSGLGLWLVYWLVQILGGTVEFDPEAGPGATVTITVPSPDRD